MALNTIHILMTSNPYLLLGYSPKLQLTFNCLISISTCIFNKHFNPNESNQEFFTCSVPGKLFPFNVTGNISGLCPNASLSVRTWPSWPAYEVAATPPSPIYLPWFIRISLFGLRTCCLFYLFGLISLPLLECNLHEFLSFWLFFCYKIQTHSWHIRSAYNILLDE